VKTPLQKNENKSIQLQIWLNKLIHIIRKSKELFSQTHWLHSFNIIINPDYTQQQYYLLSLITVPVFRITSMHNIYINILLIEMYSSIKLYMCWSKLVTEHNHPATNFYIISCVKSLPKILSPYTRLLVNMCSISWEVPAV
jgi:hypothetical protein